MSEGALSRDELKRKLRELKKLELRIRFGGVEPSGKTAPRLVWDAFFDLREPGSGRAKYSLRDLAAMDRESFREAVSEFLLRLYGSLCPEDGTPNPSVYDPEILSRLGLPPDADEPAVKKRFHELALKHHPDTGGDASRFISLMDEYRKLIGRGE